MLWAGAGRGESRKEGGAHSCPHPLGTPPPRGPLWGFYSCEANIPGAHRASKIISHRQIAVLPNEKMMT